MKRESLTDIPQKLKKESVVAEENITKELYKDYVGFKTELWQNVCANSPEKDKLLMFKKTQKLLDRFLFIFFAEDSGLLPPNSISRMVERYEKLIELDAEKPLYEIFKHVPHIVYGVYVYMFFFCEIVADFIVQFAVFSSPFKINECL